MTHILDFMSLPRTKNCEHCGNIFTRKKENNGSWKRKRFCNESCLMRAYRGSNKGKKKEPEAENKISPMDQFLYGKVS